MHDRPLAVDLAIANAQAYHQLNFVSARLCSTTAGKTMAERHVIARCDAQFANFEDTRVPKPGEENAPTTSCTRCPLLLQLVPLQLAYRVPWDRREIAVYPDYQPAVISRLRTHHMP